MDNNVITQIVYPELTSTEKLKLDGSNFGNWKIKMKLVLFGLGLSHVLTDPQPPEPTDDSSKEERESRDKWISDNRRCRCVMLFAMDNVLFRLYDDCTTAKAILDSLTRMYVSTSLPRRMNLFRKYTEHKMSEETRINEHLIEMRLMAIQLREAGLPVPEDMQVVVLMNSLPDSWEEIKRIILFMKPEEQTLIKVSENLRMAGDYRALERGEEPANKKQRNNEGGFRGKCFACGKRGHIQADCPDNPDKWFNSVLQKIEVLNSQEKICLADKISFGSKRRPGFPSRISKFMRGP